MFDDDAPLSQGGGGGGLRYISDGKCEGLFMGLKFCNEVFWVRDFGKDFFGG